MEINGAKALIKSLEHENVDTIFGYPGGVVIPIYDELYQQDAVHHYLVRHEQAAHTLPMGMPGRPGK